VIDCQVSSQHLVSLGAEEIPRSRFMALLQNCVDNPAASSAWHQDLARPQTVAADGIL
jgi:leucyl/phenylalanyl-tRNA--protein transferase